MSQTSLRSSQVSADGLGSAEDQPVPPMPRWYSGAKKAAVRKRTQPGQDKGLQARSVIDSTVKVPGGLADLLSMAPRRSLEEQRKSGRVLESSVTESVPSQENHAQTRRKQAKRKAKNDIIEVKSTFEERNEAAIKKRLQRVDEQWRKHDDNKLLQSVGVPGNAEDTEFWGLVAEKVCRKTGEQCERRYWHLQQELARSAPKKAAPKVSKVPQKGTTRHWKLTNAIRQTAFESQDGVVARPTQESQPSQRSSIAWTPRQHEAMINIHTGLTPVSSTTPAATLEEIAVEDDDMNAAIRDLKAVEAYVDRDQDKFIQQHKQPKKRSRKPKNETIDDPSRALSKLVTAKEDAGRRHRMEAALADARWELENAHTAEERNLASERVLEVEEQLNGDGSYSD